MPPAAEKAVVQSAMWSVCKAGVGQPQNIRPTFHPSAISGGEGRPRQLTVAGRDFLLRPCMYSTKHFRSEKGAGSGFGSAGEAGCGRRAV